VVPEPASVGAASSSPPSSAAAAAEPRSRCALCNKKMTLAMRFGCKCGSVFCTAHRQPEAHACQHDWKTQVRLQIQKANPRVVASKVDKF
jgi:predicted nucleic acid binding AN1-type Zn finger protein